MPELEAGGLTERVAAFVVDVSYEDLPEAALEAGRKSILDTLGVALSGATAEPTRILREYMVPSPEPKPEGCVVIASKARAPAVTAAFLNGVAMHADDFDDTLRSVPPEGYHGSVHPTAPVIAALLALAERDRKSGRDVTLAYHVGVEVAAKLNDAIGSRHFMAGFHPTGTCGLVGAAVAAAKLLGLDALGIRHALGIACSQASGLRENFGSMVKPFHTGHAAFGGLLAADLAARGFTASTTILDAPRGFLKAYGDGFHEAAIKGRLGNPWSFVDPGMWLKPYPSGMRTHPAMTRLTRLMAEEGFKAGDLDALIVKTSAGVHHTLLHHNPASGLQAKFSMPYCLAVILVRGGAGLADFTDEAVHDPDVRRVMERIRYESYTDEQAARENYATATTLLDIVLRDGRRWSLRVDTGKGGGDDPMLYDEVVEKAKSCAVQGDFPEARVDRLGVLIARLDELETLDDMVATLSV